MTLIGLDRNLKETPAGRPPRQSGTGKDATKVWGKSPRLGKNLKKAYTSHQRRNKQRGSPKTKTAGGTIKNGENSSLGNLGKNKSELPTTGPPRKKRRKKFNHHGGSSQKSKNKDPFEQKRHDCKGWVHLRKQPPCQEG